MLQQSEPISFTDSAVRKVSELISGENNPALKLRVSVSGGGCSGYQYDISFDDQSWEDDELINAGQFEVVIDAMSLQYLRGTVIDYQETLQGAEFVIQNPNAKITCGCGNSFAVEE